MSTTDYRRVCEAIRQKLDKAIPDARIEIINRDLRERKDLIAAGFIRRDDIDVGQAGAEKLNLWVVSRRDSNDEKEAQECDTIVDSFIIRGYHGYNDAAETELVFQQDINTIREAFRLHDSLDGSCETAGPAVVETIDWAIIGGLLCHYCEIRYDVQFYFTGDSA